MGTLLKLCLHKLPYCPLPLSLPIPLPPFYRSSFTFPLRLLPHRRFPKPSSLLHPPPYTPQQPPLPFIPIRGAPIPPTGRPHLPLLIPALTLPHRNRACPRIPRPPHPDPTKTHCPLHVLHRKIRVP